jgi:hypothetical protein
MMQTGGKSIQPKRGHYLTGIQNHSCDVTTEAQRARGGKILCALCASVVKQSPLDFCGYL